MSLKTRLWLAASALLANTLASAAPTLHLISTAGLSVGGDKLQTVQLTHGRTEHIYAGGLLYLGVGPSVEFTGTPFSVQTLLGYHVDSSSATNVDVKFERITLDTLGFYRVGNNRFGAGMTNHFSPEYSQSTFYDYQPVGKDFGFALRAVSIHYQPHTYNGTDASGAPRVNGSFLAAGVYLYL